MFLTIVSFVVVLGILVFFHELGHYWVARRNGIVVEEFGIGYPPRLVRLFTYDGTVFTLNALPFGGFARMKGEDAGDMTPGSFNAASRGARAATLFAGPVMNALLAVALFAASFMAGFPAPVGYPQLATVAGDSLADDAGLQAGDVVLAIHGDPALVSAIPELPFRVWAREDAGPSTNNGLLIMREGAVLTLPLESDIDPQELLVSLDYIPVLTTRVTLVAPGSPAEGSGILPGDIVYQVNDITITPNSPLHEAILDVAGTEAILTVLRGQEWLQIPVTPRTDPPPGEGALGVQIEGTSTLASLSPTQALWEGVRSTGQYVVLVLQLPVKIIMGQMAPADAQVSGPVGIAQLVGGAVSATLDTGLWFPILRLSAVLSAALAITNLLPLPALDGGRLLFIGVETIRGRRINPEREGLVHMVGFMLLLGLLVIVTVQDIRSAQEGIDWLSILGQ